MMDRWATVVFFKCILCATINFCNGQESGVVTLIGPKDNRTVPLSTIGLSRLPIFVRPSGNRTVPISTINFRRYPVLILRRAHWIKGVGYTSLRQPFKHKRLLEHVYFFQPSEGEIFQGVPLTTSAISDAKNPCQCQCNSYTYTDQNGKIHGNCKR